MGFGHRCNGKLKGSTVIIILRGNTVKIGHFSCLSPRILVTLLRQARGSDSVSGQSCNGKLKDNTFIIKLRSNNIEVKHWNSLSPGILSELFSAVPGLRQTILLNEYME